VKCATNQSPARIAVEIAAIHATPGHGLRAKSSSAPQLATKT
jgi:hypothetical protein